MLSYSVIVAASSTVPASAAIIHTTSGASLSGNDFLPLDVDNDSYPDFVFTLSNCGSCTSLGILGTGAYNSIVARYIGGYPYPYANALNPGDPIGFGAQWYSYGAYLGYGYGGDPSYPSVLIGDFVNRNEPGFLGLQFQNGSGDIFFGWARVRVFTDPNVPSLSMQLLDYAYENRAGEQILAGDTGVPEPSTLGLLASGVLGLAAWRKRKAA